MQATQQQGLLPVFGAYSIQESFREPSQQLEVYKILKEGGCNHIDNARIYYDAEDLMGQTQAGTKHGFIVDTKVAGGFAPGTATRQGTLDSAKTSLEKLKMDKVDIFYIHAFDKKIPLSETLAGVQDAYEAGYFNRFGLSNFTAEQVQEAYDYQKSKGWILPSHFQGNYNPVARHIEADLFPTLRKLNMSFYAYSPLAGGFLTKSKDQILGDSSDAGRFNSSNPLSGLYKGLYSKPKILESLQVWGDIANKANISKAELAFRWLSFHSPLKSELGDGLIFGASKTSQISNSIAWMKIGPLDDHIAKEVEKVWELVKDEAPINNTDNM